MSPPPEAAPRVTVVVPCRNERATIRACLRSVREQRPTATVVVVDNGSTDGSDVLAAELADRVLTVAHGTIGHLRNVGAAATRPGDVIAFLDADCTAEPGWLAAAVAALESAEVVGARTLAPLDSSWVARRWADLEARLARPGSYVGSANMAVRRTSFDALGGFDERLGTAEDVDLCERVVARGGRIALVPVMRVIHHGLPQTVVGFVRRQLWHASAPGWWWRASPRARLLSAGAAGWLLVGAASVASGLIRPSVRPPVAWLLCTATGIGALGILAGSRRAALADGSLLGLWAVAHAARLRTGRRPRNPGPSQVTRSRPGRGSSPFGEVGQPCLDQ